MVRATGTLIGVITPFVIALTGAAPLQGQDLFSRLRDAAGRKANEALIPAQMLDAKAIDLESRNLTVAVPPVSFGVSSVDVKEGIGIRIHGYFFNAGDQSAGIAFPSDSFFVLVDARGRRFELVGKPSIKSIAGPTQMLSVPALERVPVEVLFAQPSGAGAEAILKVGSAGVIRGLPLTAAGSGAAAAATTVAPPPPPTPPAARGTPSPPATQPSQPGQISPTSSTPGTAPVAASGGSLVGDWRWQCCSGNPRTGTLKITSQSADGSFTGDLYDTSSGAYDSKVTGQVRGNDVMFDRTGSWGSQRWTGNIVRDAGGISAMQGSWTGTGESSFADRSFTISRYSDGPMDDIVRRSTFPSPSSATSSATSGSSAGANALPVEATPAEVQRVVAKAPSPDVRITVAMAQALPPAHKLPVGNPNVLLVSAGPAVKIESNKTSHFSTPVPVTLPYRKSTIPPSAARRIQVAARHTESGKTTWELLPASSVDTAAGTVGFDAYHFSEFQPVAEEKAAEIPEWAVEMAVTQLGGMLSAEGVETAKTIRDFLLKPTQAYLTNGDTKALDMAIFKFLSAGLKAVFPAYGISVKVGTVVINGASGVVEAMITSEQSQQYEASLFGTSSAGMLSRINNLFAEVPLFSSGAILNRGISSENFGRTVRSEEDLRTLWFVRYRDDLRGGPMGITPSGPARIDEELQAKWPTILGYWRVKRGPVVMRELQTAILQAAIDAANKLRERQAALGENQAEQALAGDVKGAFKLKEVRVDPCVLTGGRKPANVELSCSIDADGSHVVAWWVVRTTPETSFDAWMWAMDLNAPPKEIGPGRTFTIAPSGRGKILDEGKLRGGSTAFGLGLTAGQSYAWVGINSKAPETKAPLIDNTSFKFTAPDNPSTTVWEAKLTMFVGSQSNFGGMEKYFPAKGTITYVYEKNDPTTCPSNAWERVTGASGDLFVPTAGGRAKTIFSMRGSNVVVVDTVSGRNNNVIFEAPPKCVVWNQTFPLRLSVTQFPGGPKVTAFLVVQGHATNGLFSLAAGQTQTSEVSSVSGAKAALETMWTFDGGWTPYQQSQPPDGRPTILVYTQIQADVPGSTGAELRWFYVRGGKKP